MLGLTDVVPRGSGKLAEGAEGNIVEGKIAGDKPSGAKRRGGVKPDK